VLRRIPADGAAPEFHLTRYGVGQASSMWDSIAGETEMGAALRELRRLDPWFNAEDWKVDITDHLLPDLMGSWLRVSAGVLLWLPREQANLFVYSLFDSQGEAKVLSDWMSEAVHNKLVAEITQRKKEGLVIGKPQQPRAE
jgi:hypothetical protein